MRRCAGVRVVACAVALAAVVAIGVWAIPVLTRSAAVDDDETAVGVASDEDDADAQGDDSARGDDIEDLDPQPAPNPATLDERLDGYLDDAFGASHMPGLAVAVVDSRGIAYERVMGDVEGADAPMLIGSLSKSFTAACVMQLVERGLVELDAPAKAYLGPDASGVPASITVRSLLNQTSGFGYHDSLAQALGRDEQGPTAGTFSYANANYDALGRIVECVSGQSYADYLREHVLAPLGMDRSSADPWAVANEGGSTLASQMAPGHRSWFGAYVADGFRHEGGEWAWGDEASGYIAASLDDMASYLRMYLNGGVGASSRVLSASSVSQMLSSGVPDPNGDTSYAMGWSSFAWDGGEEVFSHDGSVENYCARMVLLPERGLAIVVMGDAADELAGSSLFFDLADGVVASVVADDALVPDDSGYAEAHAEANGWAAIAVAGSALPAVLAMRRRAGAARRGDLAMAAALTGVAGPALVLSLPDAWGVAWRDLATFVPDIAVTLVLCAALLVAGGLSWAVRLAASLRAGRA